ncbi:MAG: hypothetical protein L6306_06555 [Planctomycetales bacterium]|nr:hypothetical protein [Planctomycetales bacterium]
MPGPDPAYYYCVVLTPHVGSNTVEADCRMARACLADIAEFHAGKVDDLARVDSS